MGAPSLDVRIDRIRRNLVAVENALLVVEPERTASRQNLEGLRDSLSTTLRILQHRVALANQPPMSVLAQRRPASPSARPLLQHVTTIPASAPLLGFLALPLPARHRPARDEDVELVTVWTPHRDAPSLIGPQTSRDLR